MAPRIPAPKPRGDVDILDLLWEHFFGNIPILGDLLDMFNGTYSGGSSDGGLIAGFFNALRGRVDDVEDTANAADAAAAAANNTVTALLTGGTRTVYTSNFTYVKPGNLVKLGIVVMGGGGAGLNAQLTGSTAPRSLGGGYIYFELPGTSVPASVNGVVPAGRAKGSGTTTPTVASFGTIVSSPTDGTGSKVSHEGYGDLNNSAPGSGGSTNPDFGRDGGFTPLAAGGSYSSSPGQDGANAATTGTGLAGGGGGAGGQSVSTTTTVGGSSDGGDGGFPGGAGGHGGRALGVTRDGGKGGNALIALIEWTS